MQNIYLKNFTLEKYDSSNNEHMLFAKRLDNDELIKKYIIGTFGTFMQLVDYYNLYEDDIFNSIYIIRKDNILIGTIELDGTKDDLYLNYSLLKEYRNKNIGSKMLEEVTKYLLEKTKRITLSIREDNDASKKLALKTGYKPNNNCFIGYVDYEIISM